MMPRTYVWISYTDQSELVFEDGQAEFLFQDELPVPKFDLWQLSLI